MPDIPGVINWPAAPDSAVTLLQVRDLTSTTLTATINATAMTIPVASTSGWTDTGVVTIEGEHITYTAKTSTSLTVGARGAFEADGGTAAASHSLGAAVTMRVIAATHRVLVDAILAVQAKQGAGADVPAAGEFAKGTGAGTSGWSPLAGSEVNTALGYTAANAATLSAHTAAANPHSGSQPLDTELSALATLTSAADRVPFFTGPGTAALTPLTAAGRALVDDADAAAQRATLELGSIATQSANAVAITGGTITGITDLAITEGGTGASTASGARSALGLAIGTDVQAQDAELQALAGLVSAADRLPYFTGSGVAALATFTAAGRALVDDPDATAQRATLGLGSVDNTSDAGKPISTATQTALDGKQPLSSELTTIAGIVPVNNDVIQRKSGAWVSRTMPQLRTDLGLVIGSDVQAYDIELAAIAGLTSAANKLPYFTGSGTAALADLTAAGRALLDDADVSAQRTTLGIVPPGSLLIGTPITFSGVSAVNLPDNTFTSDFVSYRLVMRIVPTADSNIWFRLRASGSNSATGYYRAGMWWQTNGVNNFNQNGGDNQTEWYISAGGTSGHPVFIDMPLMGPKVADRTSFISSYTAWVAGTVTRGGLFQGSHFTQSAYDAGVVSITSGTMTGTIWVYGLGT